MAELPPLSPSRTLDSSSDRSLNSRSPTPSLVRNLSSTRLSAKAVEFVPTKPITPPPSPIVILIPPPQQFQHYQHPGHPQKQLNSPGREEAAAAVTVQGMPSPSREGLYSSPSREGLSSPSREGLYSPSREGLYSPSREGLSSPSREGLYSPSREGLSSPSREGLRRSGSNLSEEATLKLVNQVEYYFSDINLATTDHLIRFMNKDAEGYVPITVVASFKKIKALVSSNSQLADVLRNSTKLVVSEDGKKVKRRHHLIGPDMDELLARIIVAENLPEDHCYQNLMKIFSTVGSVKSIRTCQPQMVNNGGPPASRQSKGDNMLHCSKLHAYVEYETIELAEKAVLELNDGDNWRNGLKVRPLSKRSPKPQQARGKRSGTPGTPGTGSEGEGSNDEDGTSRSDQIQHERQSDDFPGESDFYPNDSAGEEQGTEKEGGQKKVRNRGRGKARGRGQNNLNTRAVHQIGSPPRVLGSNTGESFNTTPPRPPPGPRMPDGTKGFSMGRGKPVAVNTA